MGVWVVELGRGDGRPMSGRGRMGFGRKSCVRRWIGQVVPQDREDRTKPDISGHWGQAVKVCGGWRGKTRRFTPGRSLDNALSGGRYLLVKESLAGPQRRVREEPKKDSPSTLRKFVAFFWTKRRDRRRGGGLGSDGLAGGYEFGRIGAELFWPDFAAKKRWGTTACMARRGARECGTLGSVHLSASTVPSHCYNPNGWHV